MNTTSDSLLASDNSLLEPRRQPWSRQAGAMIDSIRINAVSLVERDGRKLLLKRRRASGCALARTANLFFKAAGHPVSVWVCPRRWQAWEVQSFNLLHRGEYQAFAEAENVVCADFLPGTSLAAHFDKGTFDPAMLDAAGAELRRSHELGSPLFKGAWSHGDPNLANFLYCACERRARLIDFEVVHDPAMPAHARHVEDLLSLLQDLLGCASDGDWIPGALRFLEAYDAPPAMRASLRERLRLPGGVARLWWWIRTNYVPFPAIESRLERLREAL